MTHTIIHVIPLFPINSYFYSLSNNNSSAKQHTHHQLSSLFATLKTKLAFYQKKTAASILHRHHQNTINKCMHQQHCLPDALFHIRKSEPSYTIHSDLSSVLKRRDSGRGPQKRSEVQGDCTYTPRWRRPRRSHGVGKSKNDEMRFRCRIRFWCFRSFAG